MNRVLRIDGEHPDEAVVTQAANIVRNGGIIVYPTETLYGIGADGRNPAAIRKVQQAKQRRESKPILVIVGSVDILVPLVLDITPNASLLMNAFWPGPLTMVFSASTAVPSELTLGTGTIGIRIPSNPFCLSLLEKAGVPLTSTSANLSGEQPARRIEQIEKQLSGIDLFIDAGELPESQASTVIDVTGSSPKILRQGAVSLDCLRAVVPEIQNSNPSN
jgi:L-threonylcarbamoyladenylate synthase